MDIFCSLWRKAVCTDCLFAEGGLPAAVKKTLFYLLAPVAMLLALLAIQVVLHMLPVLLRKRTAMAVIAELWDKLASNAIVVLFFFLPSLLRITFSLFACVEIDRPQGTSSDMWLKAVGRYWSLDVSQPCFGAWQKGLSLGLGIPMVVLLCIVLPSAVILLTLCNKERMQGDPSFSRHYGFLYHTYKPSVWYGLLLLLYKPSCRYWEGIVALQTTVFVAVSVFGYSLGPYFQNLLLVLALMLSGMLLTAVKPYASPSAQNVMVRGVIAVLLTTFAALSLVPDGYVQGASTSEAYKLVIGSLLVAMNVSFVVYACWSLIKVAWSQVIDKAKAVCVKVCCVKPGWARKFTH
eukprot:GHUV01012743.1.p1 GENE.GHUV01012743.1~~GHUV01012743.1.p1  ORF type:complete len:349 (+),score=49.56 GHUV01012743.1:349-1395(+)